MVRGAVNLSALAEEIMADLRSSDPQRNLSVVIRPGLMTSGDKQLLRVALDNLLGNAWKFTGKQAEPRIEFGETTIGSEMVYFVRDNGAGFDMAYRDKMFQVFQRLHSTKDFEGTGIGLATVQRIIRRHSGRIWCEGEVGVGATFYFTLPTPEFSI
jgi:light-regulated signal transduction histidine kinase (bacteriophytochrome)